jgi:hypothetical protein
MSNITLERLKALFHTHPDVAVFFITSDGMAFFNVVAADSHSQRLRDKAITEISRNEVEEAEPESFADDLGTIVDTRNAGTPDASLAFALQELSEIDTALPPASVVVPASNILASEEQAPASIVFEALKNALQQVQPIAEEAAAAIAPAIAQIMAKPDDAPANEEPAPAAPEEPAAPASKEPAPAAPEEVPAPANEEPAPITPELTPLQVALQTPEAERTSIQKGLITKSNKAKAIIKPEGL